MLRIFCASSPQWSIQTSFAICPSELKILNQHWDTFGMPCLRQEDQRYRPGQPSWQEKPVSFNWWQGMKIQIRMKTRIQSSHCHLGSNSIWQRPAGTSLLQSKSWGWLQYKLDNTEDQIWSLLWMSSFICCATKHPVHQHLFPMDLQKETDDISKLNRLTKKIIIKKKKMSFQRSRPEFGQYSSFLGDNYQGGRGFFRACFAHHARPRF